MAQGESNRYWQQSWRGNHHERHVTRTPPKLALPWILEEDWPQWQAVDRGVPTYEKWVESFDKNLKLAESYGWPYERVPVRPDPFNEWCKTRKRTAGKFDRSLYALEILRGRSTAQPANLEEKALPDTAIQESQAASLPKSEGREDGPGTVQPALPQPTNDLQISAPAP
ncbi:MAG: hypothetical protein JNJ53_02065 [Rhizobiales bacterium]|nr:hypothetical protein [Hyphomicrobiales bacterium]